MKYQTIILVLISNIFSTNTSAQVDLHIAGSFHLSGSVKLYVPGKMVIEESTDQVINHGEIHVDESILVEGQFSNHGFCSTIEDFSVSSNGNIVNNGNLICNSMLTNNGHLTNSGLIKVSDDFLNIGVTECTDEGIDDLTINSKNRITLDGDWVNNGLFISGKSEVELQGYESSIKGINESNFNELSCLGQTLYLKLTTHTHYLNLNETIIKTDSNILGLNYPSPDALQYSSGRIHTEDNGFFTRNLLDEGEYMFPVAHVINNSLKYRPIALIKENLEHNVMKVAMVNKSVINDGYDNFSDNLDVTQVNESFYHTIERIDGLGGLSLKYYFEKETDLINRYIGQYNNDRWEERFTVETSYGEGLQMHLTREINDFETEVFALVDSKPSFFMPNSFTPNSDGVNDIYKVHSDQKEHLSNFNFEVRSRNGDVVFSTQDPFFVWNGGDEYYVPSGSYLFNIQCTLNGTTEIKKYNEILNIIR